MDVRATDHAERVLFVELHQHGHSYHQIATQTGRNYYTVRHWIRIFKKQGWAGIDPSQTGKQKVGSLARFDPKVKYAVLRLKRKNPGWGLDVLLLALRRRRSLQGVTLPSRTALYYYLRPYLPRLRPGRRLPTVKPKPEVAATATVHDRWQMDFKGEIKVQPAGLVTALNICDEHSSAPLAGVIYASRGTKGNSGMTSRTVQQALRQVFANWGRPQQLRMDRDSVFVGSPRLQWPGVLLLWLVGLGIEPVVNRPHRPTDNAQIERLNRTWLEHVGFSLTTASVTDIQHATDLAWHDRLYHLPSRNKHCQGQTPAQTFPTLFSNPMPFSPDEERSLFDLTRVHAYLAQWQWRRKVDHTGCISMHDNNRLVSRLHRRQIVKVHFDLTDLHFVATAVDGQFLKRFTIPGIDADYIIGTGSSS